MRSGWRDRKVVDGTTTRSAVKHGDISNDQAGRLWFVAEGLVLLPVKHENVWLMPSARKIGNRRAIASFLRSTYELNTWTYKRMWDLAWRFDFKLAIVTFNVTPDYGEVLGEWLEEFDIPAPVRAFTYEAFLDSVVMLPSCIRVYDANPSRALSFGSKGTYIDPQHDFEPLQ